MLEPESFIFQNLRKYKNFLNYFSSLGLKSVSGSCIFTNDIDFLK